MIIPEDFGGLLAELALLEEEKREIDVAITEAWQEYERRMTIWAERQAALTRALKEHTGTSGG